jgi:hypothetical protein
MTHRTVAASQEDRQFLDSISLAEMVEQQRSREGEQAPPDFAARIGGAGIPDLDAAAIRLDGTRVTNT